MTWMCKMCFPDGVEIAKLFPGCSFCYSKANEHQEGGWFVLGGQGHQSDIIIEMKERPARKPKEKDDDTEYDKWLDVVCDNYKESCYCKEDGYPSFILYAEEAYFLIHGCVEHLGYKTKGEGLFFFWIADKLAEFADNYERINGKKIES